MTLQILAYPILQIIVYAVEIPIIIYFAIKIAPILAKNHGLNQLFVFLVIALIADILSTLYFVYLLGFGWSTEANSMVRRYGNTLGHLNILLLNHFVFAISIYVAGFLINKLSKQFTYLLYCFLIVIIFSVSLINIILPTLVILLRLAGFKIGA